MIPFPCITAAAYVYVKGETVIEVINRLRLKGTLPPGKRVVCIGDSITLGVVSYNYVKILEDEFRAKGFSFINEGVNSECAYHVLQRMDRIISYKPDYATVLIGTNDANSVLNRDMWKPSLKLLSLPEEPSLEFYRTCLRKIVRRLLEETEAAVALLSIPPIGEADDEARVICRQFNEVVREAAEDFEVDYLPVFESMLEYISMASHTQAFSHELYPLLTGKAVFEKYIMRKSYDEIAEENGLILHSDLLHLNSRGAGIIADLIGEFLVRKSEASKQS